MQNTIDFQKNCDRMEAAKFGMSGMQHQLSWYGLNPDDWHFEPQHENKSQYVLRHRRDSNFQLTASSRLQPDGSIELSCVALSMLGDHVF